MSKKSGSDLMAQLREQRLESLADVPPVLAKAAAPPPPAASEPETAPKPKSVPAKPAKVAKPVTIEREKTSVNLTGPASAALRQLQAFMMVDCEAGSTGAAAVINIALELAAMGLPGNKDKLVKLLGENRQADKRRRTAE